MMDANSFAHESRERERGRGRERERERERIPRIAFHRARSDCGPAEADLSIKTQAAKATNIKSFFYGESLVRKGNIMILYARTRSFRLSLLWLCAVSLGLPIFAQSHSHETTSQPWMNTSLSPDERAALVVKEMTIDEKIALLHGTGMKGLSPMSPLAIYSNGGAGYVVGIPRLGIPAIQMSDAAYGVRSSGENGRYSTALPSNLG